MATPPSSHRGTKDRAAAAPQPERPQPAHAQPRGPWPAVSLTTARPATYGTASPTDLVAVARVPGTRGTRSLTPAAPIGGYGGVHVSV